MKNSRGKSGHTQGTPPNGLKNGKRAEAAIHEKFTDLLAHSCGQLVTATVSSGAKYRGLLLSVDVGANADTALSAVLVRPVVISEPLIEEKSNVDKTLPLKLVIQAKDLLDLEVSLPSKEEKVSSPPSAETKASTERAESPKLPQKTKVSPEPSKPTHKEFKTDRDISKGFEFRERELQRWQPDDDSLEMTLESSNDGGWDQFKTNEQKFGVESTYDEHLYTTRVNVNADDYKERLSRAEKLAREIEGQSSTDRHVLEERGVKVDDSGLDEEDKYSGVLRDEPVDNRGNELMAALRNGKSTNATPLDVNQGNYSTPRQRAAQYHNDPAIISSSASTKKAEQKEGKPSEESFRLNARSEFNALREFSANFKVPHKIPNDLLPILAKDKLKQDEILKKTESKPVSPEISKSEPKIIKKDSKFKLNPKAAAFTPAKPTSPLLNSPRNQIQRPFSNGSSGSNGSRRHQITAVDFFGAGKVPSVQSQKEKVLRFKTSFNPFLTAKRNHKDDKPLILEKAFVTPPTWDSTVEQTFEELIAEQCSQDLGDGYMQSPIMAVPGAGPHFAAPGFPQGMKFGSQPYHNPTQYQQQYQMMMYQQFQGMPPGQPQMMFAPPGEPQFMPPGGYVVPRGFQSPTNGHVTMHTPYQNQSPNNRRYQNKRGGNHERT